MAWHGKKFVFLKVAKCMVLMALLSSTTEALFDTHDDVYSSPKYAIKFDDNKHVPRGQLKEYIKKSLVDDPEGQQGSFEIIKHATGLTRKNNSTDPSGLFSSTYLCYIPLVNATVSEESRDLSLIMPDKESKLEAAKSVALTMRNFGFPRINAVKTKDNEKATEKNSLYHNCIYKNMGYWTYEFCFDQSIVQFHAVLDNKRITMSQDDPIFNLAKFDSTDKLDDLMLNAELERDKENDHSWSFVQRLGAGDRCDLSGLERVVQVKYICDKNENRPVTTPFHEHTDKAAGTKKLDNGISNVPSISWIKEFKTCQYEMAIHVPALCLIKGFDNKKYEKVHDITCSKIVEDDEVVPVKDKVEQKNLDKGQSHVPESVKYIVENKELIQKSISSVPQDVNRIYKENYDIVPLGHNYYLGIPKDVDSGNPAKTNLQVLLSSNVEILDYVIPKEELKKLVEAAVGVIKYQEMTNTKIQNLRHDDSYKYIANLYNYLGEYVSTVTLKMSTSGNLVFKSVYYSSGYPFELDSNFVAVKEQNTNQKFKDDSINAHNVMRTPMAEVQKLIKKGAAALKVKSDKTTQDTDSFKAPDDVEIEWYDATEENDLLEVPKASDQLKVTQNFPRDEL